MESAFSDARERTICLILALAVIWAVIPAARTLADIEQAVKLRPGESYTIYGIEPDTTPEVRFSNNPNAFMVQSRAAGELLVLAEYPGKGTIRVTSGGKSETYAIMVAAADGSIDPPAPMVPASMVGGGALAGSGSGSASPLDPGTGPAGSAASKTNGVALADSVPAGAIAGSSSGANGNPKNDPGAVKHPWVIGPIVPSQPVNGQRFTSDPPAQDTSDSLEREPAVNGHHYLSPDAISMMSGTSRVYDFVAPLRRVSIANSKIADIQVINPHQLMLVGHDPGFTT
ncbi:MAG TPA: pilus assembly protein N-terminal domain-containing protein, partial [Candidatus Binataceae bacterium]|nr:pilus assembly protein N-terminal domain-containing protein [Candidatus Binataceae bacterium]